MTYGKAFWDYLKVARGKGHLSCLANSDDGEHAKPKFLIVNTVGVKH